MKIQFLGVGALSILTNNTRILIDSFNSYNESPVLISDDIILFTHDDGDHFLPEKLLNQTNKNMTIIGPPSIAYPLLSDGKINPSYINIVYPPHLNKPIMINKNNIEITVFQTMHFVDWHPVHVSFILNVENKKIFIAGDCSIIENFSPLFGIPDILIISFIDKNFVEKKCPQIDAIKRHISEIKLINKKFNPEMILGNHLVNCDWSVDSKALENMIKKEKIKNVKILHSINETIEI